MGTLVSINDGWPASGELNSGWHDYWTLDKASGINIPHTGQDISPPVPVGPSELEARAIASGRLSHFDFGDVRWGCCVAIEITNELSVLPRLAEGLSYYLIYAHLVRGSETNAATIARGQRIGTVGNTGRVERRLEREPSLGSAPSH